MKVGCRASLQETRKGARSSRTGLCEYLLSRVRFEKFSPIPCGSPATTIEPLDGSVQLFNAWVELHETPVAMSGQFDVSGFETKQEIFWRARFRKKKIRCRKNRAPDRSLVGQNSLLENGNKLPFRIVARS